MKPANSCPSRPIRDFLGKSLRGYAGAAKKALGFAAALAAVAVSSLLISVPLWYFSSRHKEGYGLFALLVTAAAAVYPLGRKLLRAWREAGSFRRFAGRRLKPAARRAAGFLAAAAGLYGVVLLFVTGRTMAGVSAGALYALFFGFYLSARRDGP